MKSRMYLLWPAVFVLLVAAGAGAAAIVSAGAFGVAWSVALGDATATGSSAGYGTGSGSTVATGSTSSFGVALGVGANGGSGTGSGTGVAGFTDGTAYAGGVAEASASGGGGFGFSVGLGGAIATTGSNPNNHYTYQSNTDGEQVKARYSTTRGATSFVASEKTADYGSNVIYQDKANGSSTVRVNYRSTSPTDGVAQYQVVYQEAKNGVVTYRVTYRADDGSLYTYTYRDNPSDSKPAYVKEQTRGNIDASSLSLAGGIAPRVGSGGTRPPPRRLRRRVRQREHRCHSRGCRKQHGDQRQYRVRCRLQCREPERPGRRLQYGEPGQWWRWLRGRMGRAQTATGVG